MRQSDAAAALAILCGALIGAEIFRQANPPQTLPPAPRVQIVEIPVEKAKTAVASEAMPKITLRVTSTDPDRAARFRMVLDGYPEGETTEVVTPFTLTSTRSAIQGRLMAYEGHPEIRAVLTVDGPGLQPSRTITVSGDELRVDSEPMFGESLSDGR